MGISYYEEKYIKCYHRSIDGYQCDPDSDHVFCDASDIQKTNNLITQVASVLNLELDQGDSEGSQDYTLKDLEQYSVAFESQQTLNLVAGDDGKMHYAMIDGYTLYLNKKAKDYKDVSETIKANESKFTDVIRSVIQSHSVDNISEEVVKKEALDKIQELLDSKAVVEVSLTNLVYN